LVAVLRTGRQIDDISAAKGNSLPGDIDDNLTVQDISLVALSAPIRLLEFDAKFQQAEFSVRGTV
jgi:hypothetical protein